MGEAIVPEIMGDEMLYKYSLYLLPLKAVTYSWGILMLIPKNEKKKNPLKNLINPIVLAIPVGALLGFSGLSNYMPSFVSLTLKNCAGCMGTIAMILTGFVIGGFDIKKLLKNKKVYIAAFLRLIVLPLFFIILLKFIGADETALKMTLFAFGTPLGLNTVVFPAAYGGDTSTGASMAMISHAACIITIPLLYTFIEVIC